MKTREEYLLGQYEERIAMLSDAVSTGNCATYEEYQFTCGQIKGLKAACMIIHDLKSNMENEDE